MRWLKWLWDKICGNVLYAALSSVASFFGGVRILFWDWYTSLTVLEQILLPFCVLTSAACIVMGLMLWRA